MYITIDPGHSGPFEPGACAENLTEAEVVLSIGQALAGLLSAAGHNVLLTRTQNIETDDLAFRADMANNQPADIFVSLHCNSAESAAAKGTEVYCFPGSIKGASLADCIRKRIVEAMDTVDRGTKEANFQVLRETDCPAVLVETAFLSSPDDRPKLASLAGRVGFAIAIYQGLQDFGLQDFCGK